MKTQEYTRKTQNQNPTLDKVKGAVLGFAIGDAMGAPREFSRRPTLRPVLCYETAFTKGLQAGQFTDDTQQLEIALDSLLAYHGEINLDDLGKRLIHWYTSGEARSIGRTTESAVRNLMKGVKPSKSGIDHINACGSLAIARLVPYSLLSAISRSDYKIENNEVGKILGVTHAHKKVKNMGRLFNYFVQEVANGRTVRETLDLILFEDEFLNKSIRKKLKEIKDLADSDSCNPREAIQKIGTGGFVEDVVYSAIFSAIRTVNFHEAVITSADGEGDSDSRAALTGTLSGLETGASKIPAHLKEELEGNSELEKKAAKLYYLRK